MRLLLAGTIPRDTVDLITGEARIAEGKLIINDSEISLIRGTAAMIGAACAAAAYLGSMPPHCVIGGDIGKRTGSRNVYRHLIKNLPKLEVGVLGLHYIIPDIGLHNQVRMSIQKMKHTPTLIADAGFMYVAKASGYAPFYDLFLPDLGELAFLADDKAMHPAYTRGFLTRLEDDPARLIERAFGTGNAARYLCVKGRTDHICADGKILEAIGSPMIDALEPIGGTGDTITGMVAGLVAHGYAIPEACRIACSANRMAGQMAGVTPATQIDEIISLIPAALNALLQRKAAGS
jgi:hypothetical protein